MQADLFQFTPSAPAVPTSDRALVNEKQCGHQALSLDQYLTPEWFAAALVDQADIRPGARVVDIGCGRGAFLKAIPAHAQAVGVEIDPAMAAYTEENSGRSVIVGDFEQVTLPFQPTIFMGNPPYKFTQICRWLEKMHRLLREDEGRVEAMLPAYFFQTSQNVVAWSDRWSLEQRMIPRDIFPGLKYSLVWAIFRKERLRRMFGFMLYREAAEVKELPKDVKLMLVHGRPRKGAWAAVVDAAIALRGPLHLREIYEYVCGRRPSGNPAWQEQVRKVLYTGHYQQDGDERWNFAAA